ncbi:DUF1877 family protein [Nocardia salmonicida]|uniref:DUF1877 family protein n=1 Tax=Nocardia salmonicida TaxID=53431 RepID=UPI0007A439E7|nr:DUF1877 family protein [Nocardia salmonicida]
MGPVLAFHRISEADAARITADAEAAFEHFAPDNRDDNDVYPDIWDTDFCHEYLREHNEGLVEFLLFASAKNSPVLSRFE